MQTMRLRLGQVRVEDVQWVQYYDKKDGIAIHSAYWHHDFGKRKSHGCVNLAPDDAKWLFGWTSPTLHETDSERYGGYGDDGTRVVVFSRSKIP